MLIAARLAAGWTVAALEPPRQVIRYERERPGELIHIDIKKLGRIDGVGHRITGDRTGQSSRRGRGEGPGWEYLHVAIDDASLLAAALQSRGLNHKRTRPYTPRTNGKAERFIQTSLREWAYAMPFHSSVERARATPAWLCHYNTLRPHSALGRKPPLTRLARDNLLGNDS